MKKRNFVLIIIVVFALLTFVAASVSAQDIDVDNMDNEVYIKVLYYKQGNKYQ